MFTRICTDDYVCWTLQLIVKLLTVPTIYVVRKQVQSLLCDDSHGHLRLFRGCLEATWGGTFPWTSSSSRCPPEAGVRGLDASHCHLMLFRGYMRRHFSLNLFFFSVSSSGWRERTRCFSSFSSSSNSSVMFTLFLAEVSRYRHFHMFWNKM